MRDSRHTQNNQINKVIGENEKCALFYGKKKLHKLFGQPNISSVSGIKGYYREK